MSDNNQDSNENDNIENEVSNTSSEMSNDIIGLDVDESFNPEEWEEIQNVENEKKNIVYENLSARQKELMSNKPTIVIEKMPQENLDEGSDYSSEVSSEVSDESSNEEEIKFDTIDFGDQNYEKLFEEGEVTVDIKVHKSEKEIVFENEEMVMAEIRKQLLDTLPVTKQSQIYVQQRIESEVRRIMDVKNMSVKKYKQLKRGIEYEYLSQNNWIIPIVLDKHKIYVKLKAEISKEDIGKDEKIENVESNVFFNSSLEDSQGTYQVNQKEEQKNLYELESSAKSNISYLKYINDLEDINKPYDPETSLDDKTIGFNLGAPFNSFVLRYFDLDNIHWLSHQVLSKDYTYKNVLDVHDKIIDIDQKTLIDAEKMNVVGFMILPKAGKDIVPSDSLYSDNYNRNYLTKYFRKVGNITKIWSSDDNNKVFIKIDNHGLSNNDNRVFIDGSNSYPNIDNTYQKSIIVIDENTLAIDNTKKSKSKINLIRDGDAGILYAVNQLYFDLYKVVVDGGYKTQFLATNYIDGLESNDHVKVYMFTDFKIRNQEVFDDILKMISPSIDSIIESELSNIKKCDTFDEVNDILIHYGFILDDLNEKQYSKIKEIFDEKLKEDEKRADNEDKEPLSKLVFHESNRLLFSNPQLFLADIYITSPFIQKYYGKYIHLNKPEDSLILRLSWVTKQLDTGNLYFLYVLYENLDLFDKNHNKEFVKNIKQRILDSTEDLEKSLNKEVQLENSNKKRSCKLYHYQALHIPDGAKIATVDNNSLSISVGDKIIYYIQNESYFYFENKMYKVVDGKKKEVEQAKNGTMALVGDSIYIWNEKNKEWEKSDMIPKYDHIRYICEFGDIDIKELDLDALECIYRDSIGCNSRLVSRLKDRIQFLDNVKVSFEELEESLQKDKYKNELEDALEYTILKYFSKDIKSIRNELKIKESNLENYQKENNKKEDEIEMLDVQEVAEDKPLDNLFSIINSLSNDDLKKNYIYEVIDRDGLLIGKDIYSKKYKCKMNNICGHWTYLQKIERSTDINKRSILYDELLTVFGIKNKDVYNCTNCGDELMFAEFDEVEGFAASGAYILSRDVIIDDESAARKKDLIDIERFHDCGSTQFKELLLQKGFSIQQEGDILRLCDFIINQLCRTTGVSITSNELIDIMKDSLQKIALIKGPSKFREEKLRKYRDIDHLPPYEIEKKLLKDQYGLDDIDRQYEKYYKILYRCIIAARFLICIQTAIPSYIHTSTESKCPFISFNGKEGIQYIACILDELKFVDFDGTEYKTKLNTLEEQLYLSYKDFLQSRYILDLFYKKKEYDRDLQKKLDIVLDGNEGSELKDGFYPPAEILPDNFRKLVLNCKNVNELSKYYNQLVKRMLYVSYLIKDTIKKVMLNPELMDDRVVSLIEKSSCMEVLSDKTSLLSFIQIHNPDKSKEASVFYLIDESKVLYEYYTQLFLNQPSLYRLNLQDNTIYHFAVNPIVVPDPDNTSQSIIQDMFIVFEDDGKYKGQLREYIGEGKDAKDVKNPFSKTKGDIMSKTYTTDEYKKLLADIERLNTVIPPKKDEEMEEKKIEVLETLKQDADNYLDKDIIKLVDNLASVLNKRTDQEFIEKYRSIIRNMGYFPNLFLHKIDEDALYEAKRIRQLELMEGEEPQTNTLEMERTVRMDVLNKNYQEDYRLLYLKKVFNLYFRRNISIIQNNYTYEDKIEKLRIDFISEEQAIQVQDDILESYSILQNYLTPQVRNYFNDLSFDKTSMDIDNIYGSHDIYDAKYTKPIMYSDFNVNQACLVVLHLLVQQLNNFIICIKEDEEMREKMMEKMEDMTAEERSKAIFGSPKCRYVCMFIQSMLDFIDSEKVIYDGYESIMNKYKNQQIHEILDNKQKAIIEQVEETDNFFVKQLNLFTQARITDVEDVKESLDKEQQEVDNAMELNDKMEMFENMAIDALRTELGRDPNREEIDEYKEKLKNMDEDFRLDDNEELGVVGNEDGFEEENDGERLGDYQTGDVDTEFYQD